MGQVIQFTVAASPGRRSVRSRSSFTAFRELETVERAQARLLAGFGALAVLFTLAFQLATL